MAQFFGYVPAAVGRLHLTRAMRNWIDWMYEGPTEDLWMWVWFEIKPGKRPEILMAFQFRLVGRLLIACGTVLNASIRGLGMGARGWGRVLNEIAPKAVEVVTITKAGTGLINSLKPAFPNIKWLHTVRLEV